MSSTACQITACPYDELNKHTKVLNVDTIEHFVHIYLPPDMTRNLMLYEVSKKSPDSFEVHDICRYFFRENACWLRVKSEVFSREPGQHIYKLVFIDCGTRETTSLYFSYIAQNDNPSRPYIYMNGK